MTSDHRAVSRQEAQGAGIARGKIGEGAYSEAYAWAPGQVIKLFKLGLPRRMASFEVHMLRAVHAVGVAVPELFGEVNVDRRFGIVMQRLDGPTLLQLTRTGAVTFEQAGAVVAALAKSFHEAPLPPEILSMRDYMTAQLGHDDGKLPKHIATEIVALIDRLPPGDRLCHTDLSPGNVIMTAEGPKLVDWVSAMRGPALLDLAFLRVILSELGPEVADNPERPRATNAAAQSEYARLSGISLAELTATTEPYLPIVRAFVVLGNAVPSMRERLIERTEIALRSKA